MTDRACFPDLSRGGFGPVPPDNATPRVAAVSGWQPDSSSGQTPTTCFLQTPCLTTKLQIPSGQPPSHPDSKPDRSQETLCFCPSGHETTAETTTTASKPPLWYHRATTRPTGVGSAREGCGLARGNSSARDFRVRGNLDKLCVALRPHCHDAPPGCQESRRRFFFQRWSRGLQGRLPRGTTSTLRLPVWPTSSMRCRRTSATGVAAKSGGAQVARPSGSRGSGREPAVEESGGGSLARQLVAQGGVTRSRQRATRLW